MTRCARRLSLALTALALLAPWGTGLATTPSPLAGPIKTATGPASAPSSVEQSSPQQGLQDRLAQAQAELDALPKSSAAAAGTASGAAAEDLNAQRTRLIQLVGLYRTELGRERDLADLKAQRAALAQDQGAWPPAPPGPPYSFLAVDRLRETGQTLSFALLTDDKGLAVLDREAERVRKLWDQTQEGLRRIGAALEAAGAASTDAQPLQRQLDLTRLDARVAGAAVATVTVERRYTEELRTFHGERLARVQGRIGLSAGQVRFSQGDLDQVQVGIQANRAVVDADLERAVAASVEASGALDKAKGALQAAKGEAAGGTDGQLGQTLELARVRNETAGLAVRLLTLKRLGLVREADIWDQRWTLANATGPALVRQAREALPTQRQNLDLLRTFTQSRLEQVRDRLSEQDDLTRRTQAPADAHHNRQLVDAWHEREAIFADLLQALGSLGHLLERWAEDVDERTRERSPMARIQDAGAAAWGLLRRGWGFELFVVQDSIQVEGQTISGQRSVTVGQVVRAIVILVVGYWFSRWLARRVEALAIQRLRVDAGRARIARRWLESIGLIVLVVFALTWVQIPLSVFAFLGGAVAIGAGFGMQTVLKNLISGLMILFERPFQLGDLVEVGSIRGRVTEIGVRASVVRDAKGVETLIPNSTFLEQNVTNWTYTNPRVRFSVAVRVAYGAPTRRVAEVLADVARSHTNVLGTPAPMVIFEDFGGDDMLFSLDYWVEVRPDLDARLVASELRHQIGPALAAAGIASRQAEPPAT